MTDSIRGVIERLHISRQTIQFLLQQAAAYGGEIHLPPQHRHSLTQMRRDIAQFKAELRARGVVVDDQPEDVGEVASGQNDTAAAELERRAVHYCQGLVAQLRTLRLDGLDTDGAPLQLPLEQVYTPLRLVAELPAGADTFSPDERRLLRQLEATHPDDPRARELHDALAILGHQRWTKDRPERLTIPELLRDRERRGAVLLGDPGSGKSTLLLFLALVFAQGPEVVAQKLQLPAGEAERLPILAPLSAYDDMLAQTPQLTIPEFLAHFYAERRALPGLGPVFDSALANGTALLLLDGLDEVRDAQRRRVVAEQVDHFVRVALAAGNRVIVTSRIVGYRIARLAAELRHLTVLDFGPQEQTAFARRWTQALAAHEHGDLTPQAEQQARQEERLLLAEIRATPGAAQLAANPLMLTMLALLRRRHGALPQRRVSLYNRYLTTLLDHWQHARRQSARRHTSTPARDPDETAQALIALARWFQMHHPSGTASTAQVHDQLTSFFLQDDPHQQRAAARGRARTLLDDLRQEAGLLIERGQGAISFRHLTFQEFFAGRALAQLPAEERWALLAPRLHETRWREPFLLGVAWLGTVAGRRNEAADLVRRVLTAGSPHEETLHRDLFLAADAAGDDSGLPPALLQQLADALWPLCASPVPAVASGALDRLHRLALLRSGNRACLPAVQERVIARLLHPSGGWGSEQLNALARFPLALDATARQHILDHLHDPAPSPRMLALHTLTPLVTTHPEVRAAVLHSCATSDGEVRAAAIGALVAGVAEEAELRRQLRTALDDPHGQVQETAIKVLAPLLPADRALADAVAELLDDEGQTVCRAAYDALVPLLPSRPDLLVPLVDALGALLYTDAHQESFAGWIDVTAPDRAHLWPPLLALLDGPYADRRQVAVELLSPLVEDDPAVRAALLARLNDSHPDVIEAAVHALADEALRHPDVAQAFRRAIDADQLPAEALEEAIDALSFELAQDDAWRNELLASRHRRTYPNPDAVVEGLMGLAPTHRDVREVLLGMLGRAPGYMHHRIFYVLKPLLATDPALRLRIASLLYHRDREICRAALEALTPFAEHDRACVSVLEGALRQRDGQTRERLLALLAPPGQALRVGDALIAAQLTNTDSAEAAVGRALVVQALGRLAGDLVVQPVLLACLQDESVEVRQAAIRVLAPLASTDAVVRAALIERLADVVPAVAATAVDALGPLAADHAAVRQALIQLATESPFGVVSGPAHHWLRPLAPLHTDVRTALLALLERTEEDGQLAALQTLAPLGNTDPDVRTALLRCAAEALWMEWVGLAALAPLLPQDAELRASVLQRLAHPAEALGAERDVRPLVQADAGARAAVAGWLSLPDRHLRQAAISLLKPFLPGWPELGELLLDCVDDPEPEVRAAAIRALAPMVTTEPAVFEALVAALDDPLLSVWQAAMSALAPLAPTHPRVRAQILEGLRSPAMQQRANTILSLAPYALHHPEVLAAVLGGLDDHDAWVRRATLGALVPLATANAVVREHLLGTLTNTAAWVRMEAVRALAPLERDHPAVRGALIERLGDPDAMVRAAAITRLAPLAEGDADLHTQLLALQHDPSKEVRAQLATTVGQARWPEALPLLRAFLDDPSSEVRAAALGELAQFVSREPDVATLLLPEAQAVPPDEAGLDRPDRLAPARLADLFQAFGALVRQDETWLMAVRAQLGAADWRQRGGAAQILAAAGEEAVRATLPELLQALHDWRGPESWPARLAAAAALLNHDHDSDDALAVLDEALVFDEGVLLPRRNAANVRRRAVATLSQLAALDHRPAIAARIAELLATEQDGQVLEGLYHALTSLVEAPDSEQDLDG
ncbi:MAG TPA: HEAT repeat domain-containing protein [Roseiflexaceae bacterium]|nr:HEAT repeat domain-containing protein [Roseiflexaceae bacterium]